MRFKEFTFVIYIKKSDTLCCKYKSTKIQFTAGVEYKNYT